MIKVLKSVSRKYLGCSYSTQTNFPNVCIVGSGPAGFYSAQHLLKLMPSANIDIYEKLPVPFGLVRFGVAPDHPDVKNVINTFTKTASHPKVNFFGNITLGNDIYLKELREAYHVIILTYGAELDQEFNIPGETLSNVISARRFVGWYNGLPDDKNLSPKLDSDVAVILGQGNVAVDVARILLTPVDVLKSTDISAHALETLLGNQIKSVYLVGRRGPLQVAFTIKEFREMLNIPDVSTLFRKEQMEGVGEAIASLQRPRKRLTQLIFDASQKPSPDIVNKKFCPLFFRSPLNFCGSHSVNSVNLSINKLIGEKAVQTSEVESLNCGIAFRSIGYKSISVDPDIPFNKETCTVINTPGLYAAGWLATGPSGVILSTMTNAFNTAQLIFSDINENKIDSKTPKPGFIMIKDILRQRNTPIVTWDGWEKIDTVEKERGKKIGKPREKLVDITEMLKIGSSLL